MVSPFGCTDAGCAPSSRGLHAVGGADTWTHLTSPALRRRTKNVAASGLSSHIPSVIVSAAVLKIATSNPARALKVDTRLGTIEAGKLADLVIMRGNPLTNMRNTRNVHHVVKHGNVYDSKELLASMKGKLGPSSAAYLANW